MWTDNYFGKLKEIREGYTVNWNGNRRQDAYKFGDFMSIATPIERNVWSDCRTWGLEMYPQFPVGKYYLDFANPFLRIGIEVDGKIHESNKERDSKRQQELEQAGWKIYRIDGWKTYKTHEDFEDDDTYEERTSEYLIRDLARKYKYQKDYINNELVTPEDIIKEIEIDKPRFDRQKKLNVNLFGYFIPDKDTKYRAD